MKHEGCGLMFQDCFKAKGYGHLVKVDGVMKKGVTDWYFEIQVEVSKRFVGPGMMANLTQDIYFKHI